MKELNDKFGYFVLLFDVLVVLPFAGASPTAWFLLILSFFIIGGLLWLLLP